ncbi:Exocyst complex component 5 [Oopsacas minuta]|uniref:Exocyst complex component 5 n=1 Tax=Oopsacas minuta TaxID=111878 RepID=A0AAV7K9B7_9METZ|nr:Exocyst complex component 5 [Oopsacas minuta]
MSSSSDSPTNVRSFTKQNFFNFKASVIKPAGTLYSDANSSPNNKSTNNKSQGFSFLKLDSSLTASEILPVVGDNVTTNPNLNAKEISDINPLQHTEPKASRKDTEEDSHTSKDPKVYVFGQKIEARVVIHEAEASEPPSQDVKSSATDGIIPSDNAKPLLGSLPVQKVFTGEEGERVIVEISCKLFVFDSKNKTWHSKGRNMLHLNEDPDCEHKSRIICRAQGNQLVQLNSPIWAEMLCEQSNPNSVKLSANLENDGIRVVLIQGEKRDISNLFSALETRILNCNNHKEATAKSQQSDEIDLIDTPDIPSPRTPTSQETISNKRPLCSKRSTVERDEPKDNPTQKIILDTFDNPEQVTSAFVTQVFDKIIKTHVKDELRDINKETDIDEYLSKLSDLYDKTTLLGRKLVDYEMIQDTPTATKQIKNLFYDYLHNYAEEEIHNFGTKGRTELEEYYKVLFDTTGMQKKATTTSSGGYKPRRETIRNVTVDVLFVSQDFITNILSATKQCINRCKVLCNPNELSVTVKLIYKTMMELICRDHLDYAVKLALTGKFIHQ